MYSSTQKIGRRVLNKFKKVTNQLLIYLSDYVGKHYYYTT